MDQTIFIIFQLIALVYSVVIHEVSHGVAAYSMGDTTAKMQGRLTLNPFKHIDLFGSVILPLFLFFSTGFAFGYAKPVPYDPHQLNDRRWGPAKVGFAGPASNIILALLFGIVYRTLIMTSVSPLMLDLVAGIILINLSLAFFNLMPIPPLDGHWLLFSILPASAYELKRILYQYSLPLLIVFMIFIFPKLSFVIIELFRLITGVSL